MIQRASAIAKKMHEYVTHYYFFRGAFVAWASDGTDAIYKFYKMRAEQKGYNWTEFIEFDHKYSPMFDEAIRQFINEFVDVTQIKVSAEDIMVEFKLIEREELKKIYS